MNAKPLTKEQVYERLHQQGDTVKSWAERYGYEYGQVLNVTNGRNKATRGLGREIADFSRETCTREYELYENFSKHIGKLVCRHGAKPCNKETELLGTLKASITTT